jgi:D-alanyl-D-alanine carboxypeptidase
LPRSKAEADATIIPERQARDLLGKADPFIDQVVAQDNRKLFRASFAGLDQDQAEEVCRTLERADISCIAVRN